MKQHILQPEGKYLHVRSSHYSSHFCKIIDFFFFLRVCVLLELMGTNRRKKKKKKKDSYQLVTALETCFCLVSSV